MGRVTIKQNDGGYYTSLSKNELIELVASLENKGMEMPCAKAQDPRIGMTTWVPVNRWTHYEVLEGLIVKVLNSKREGLRYDVKVTDSNNHTFIERVKAGQTYSTKEEAQVEVDRQNALLEERNRMYTFRSRLDHAYSEGTLSRELATTEEEKAWMAEWEKTAMKYDSGYAYSSDFIWASQRLKNFAEYCKEGNTTVERAVNGFWETYSDYNRLARIIEARNRNIRNMGWNLPEYPISTEVINECLVIIKKKIQPFLDIFKGVQE